MRHSILATVLASTVLASTLLATTALAPAQADDTMVTLKPEQIGQIFCLSRTGNDEAAIEGLLSPELKAAIAGAWTANAAWEAANPGEKPPLGDGIPWQAWPDYAPDCSVGLVTLMKTDARVDITYAFPGQPDAKFTDTLLLKRIDIPADQTAFWRIDNVAFATEGDLRTSLARAFEAF